MKKNNRILLTLLLVIAALFTESAFARLQKDARECVKPRFSKFTPAHLSEVAPGSTVSFVTNYTTAKASVVVTTKGITIPRSKLRVTDKHSFYIFEFELPESLEHTYARIHIKAQAKTGANTCKHRDGWLLKIAANQPVEPVVEAATATPSADEMVTEGASKVGQTAEEPVAANAKVEAVPSIPVTEVAADTAEPVSSN